jgi:hypothetical protein
MLQNKLRAFVLYKRFMSRRVAVAQQQSESK